MTKHAVGAQVICIADFIVAGRFSVTQLSALGATAPARTTGFDADTPMAKHAVELAQVNPEIELTVPGRVSLDHASWLGEMPPASTTGAVPAVATTKQAELFTHLSCDSVVYLGPVVGGVLGMSCAHVSADPDAAPASRTGPVAVVPVTKQAVVPAQVSADSDVNVTPCGGVSFDQLRVMTPEGFFVAVTPRMTAPVAVVPMARQAVGLGQRTWWRMVTPSVAGGDAAAHVPTAEDVESVIAAAPEAPNPTATHKDDVQAEDSIFSIPSDDGRSSKSILCPTARWWPRSCLLLSPALWRGTGTPRHWGIPENRR